MQGRAKIPRLDLSQYEMAFKVLVTPNAGGKIIGRGGENVAMMKKEFGVACHVLGTDNCFPNTTLQVAVFLGSRASIEQCFEILVGKIVESEESEVGLQPGQPVTIAVIMSSNATSAMIGTKGATIMSFKEQSGCNISAEKGGIAGEQVVRVSGLKEQVPHALTLLGGVIEQSQDSLNYALQDYSSIGDSSWGAPPAQSWGGKKGPATPYGGKGAKGPAAPYGGKGVAPPKGGKGPSWRPAVGAPALKRSWPDAFGSPGDLGGAGAVDFAAADGLGSGVAAEEDPAILASSATILFSIPKETIGRVLGKGGTIAAEIRGATGVALRIDPTDAEGVVNLTGTVSAVHRAHCMVLRRVMSEF